MLQLAPWDSNADNVNVNDANPRGKRRRTARNGIEQRDAETTTDVSITGPRGYVAKATIDLAVAQERLALYQAMVREQRLNMMSMWRERRSDQRRTVAMNNYLHACQNRLKRKSAVVQSHAEIIAAACVLMDVHFRRR